ncbi:S-layer homology domain-containing protein [Paenibacillus albidus]|uniref:S-layer homology domain-containing protein n=1 Tax=Paenibacillus albidus TaxID=2041023 RepID=UPI001BE6F695|nr:S-layer homology domain-containing protein [Paenibacillus albidus]MBT2291039.1 S-layer homology domain-containing protein [Paenibacillus albidus]
MVTRQKWYSKACVATLCAAVVMGTGGMPVSANYTTDFDHKGVGTDYGQPVWKDGNTITREGVDFSEATIGEMMEAIEAFDFDKFAKDNADLPWLDALLVNEGVIPDDVNDEGGANTLLSRGNALYMKTQDNTKLGFVGTVHYADTLNQDTMYQITLSTGGVNELKDSRKNYPSHMNQTYTSGGLEINQRKFISSNNSAVTLLQLKNPTAGELKLTVTVKSPFVSQAEQDELVGYRVAAPLMIGKAGQKVVEAMSYVDVHLSGDGMTPSGNTLVKEITVPAGGTVDQKVVMGWLAEEIPGSKADYEQFKSAAGNEEAFGTQVKAYNEWWADNIPYIDIPDENVKKVLYYRWWCNRFNLLEANIPGNDWQFPMNMEGVLGYNNGITVSVPWALQDLKWLRDPSYAYGTWLAQGEYSENKNYKNNPGRPNIWTWDMMQNTSQVGWEAYKIYGGGPELLKKFADYSANDVTGTLQHFKGTNPNLVYYNHGPITGNDGDTVSMHWNGGGNFARLDGSATTYANAVAAANMYGQLGDTAGRDRMNTIAGNIQQAILSEMWYGKADFDGDGKADTNGTGSFLHKKIVGGQDVFNPWRDNNMFVFNFGVVPTEGQAGYQADYLTQLSDYGDPNYYPIFPFFTADQHSIMKRVEDFKNGKTDAFGTDQFAWCNFGNYINTVRASLRHYPVKNIDSSVYQTLFDWGAWLHTVEPGNTDHLDSNEFFWLEDYFFGTPWTKDNPPNPSGNMVRAWIHHDTLGMMNYTVLEDMAGIQPRTDEKIELWPLEVDYDHFAVDNVRYHDADLSIVWQDPAKYSNANPYYKGIPVGYSLFINGELVMTADEMSHLIYDTATGKVEKPEQQVAGAVGDNSQTAILFEKGSATALATADGTSLAGNAKTVDMFNKAGVDLEHDGENLATAAGTAIESTYIENGSDLRNLADGSTIASINHTSNTALFGESPNAEDAITFKLSGEQTVDNVKVYFYNDRMLNGYGTPQTFGVEYLDTDGVTWKPVEGQSRYPDYVASNYNNVEFQAVNTSALRVRVTHSPELATGIKEIQIYHNNLNVTPDANRAPKVIVDSPVKVEQGVPLTLVPAITDDGLPSGKLTYKWVRTAGEGEVEELQTDQAVLKAIFKATGEYTYRLTVSDGDKETSIEVPVTVFVATAELSEMVSRYADKASGRIVRNPEDFIPETWTALQAELTDAKALLAKGSYTPAEIKEATDQLRAAIGALRYRNAGLLATPSASYTSAWESVYGVNDGYIPYTSGSIGNGEVEKQYGNWGGPGDSHWVQYTWSKPVSLSGSSIYFYDDGGGIQVPASYSFEYWDEASGTFVPVTGMSGQDKKKDAFNEVTFDEVKTDKLRLILNKSSAGAWTGVKEWRALSAKPEGEAPPEGAHGAIVSIDQIAVNTTINVVPVLPSKVTVTYADQTKGLADVVWDEIPLNKLSIATDFVLFGKVAGTDVPASVRISVKYDKTRLKTAIDTAGAPEVNEENYSGTPEQWAALQAALVTARAVYGDEGATEGDINNAYNALKAAYEALTPAAGNDALITGITIPGGVLDQVGLEIIVPETTTLEQLKEGLTVREGVTLAVYQEDGFTPAELLQTGFKVAVTGQDGAQSRTYTLTLAAVNPPVLTERLKAKLAEAQALDMKLYTAASQEALAAALAHAKQLLDRTGASQAEIDAAVAQLAAAIEGLQLLPSAQPSPVPTATPQPSSVPTPATGGSGDGGYTPVATPKPSAAATAVPAAVSSGSIVLQPVTGADGTVKVVLAAADIEAAVKGTTGGTLSVVIKAAAGAKQTAVELPLQALAAAQGVQTVRLEAGAATAAVPQSFLKALAAQGGRSLQLTFAPVERAKLPLQLGSQPGAEGAVSIQLSVDGVALPAASLAGQGLKALLPYTLKAGEKAHQVVAYHVGSSGQAEVSGSSRYDSGSAALATALNQNGIYVALYAQVSFPDIAPAAWAVESIEALAARGAIQGTPDGRFHPGGSVTRAEYISILMKTFDLLDETAVSSFGDVKEAAWYSAAAASAQKLGIVQGKTDGTFGGNERITRQEMAVMTYRLAQLAKLPLEGTAGQRPATAFQDVSQLPSYAAEAVTAMARGGLINGMAEGKFEPNGVATRAQAAAIIYRLLGLTP